MNSEINYYVFDRIEKEDYGIFRGYKGNDSCEVFELNINESERELIEKGFAKCDAPNTHETFCVEETAWESIDS